MAIACASNSAVFQAGDLLDEGRDRAVRIDQFVKYATHRSLDDVGRADFNDAIL
nr:hypothetical protein [Corynebacterium urogenitale]